MILNSNNNLNVACKMKYVWEGGVLIKARGLKMFWKKLNGGGRVGGTLIRDPRVFCKMITGLLLKVLDNFFSGYIAKVFII